MSTVKNWKKPLEDAILKQLDKTDLNPDDIAKLEKMIALLDGANLEDKINSTLEEKKRQLDERFEKALKKVEKSNLAATVEEGIKELKEFGEYRNAPQKIEAAEKRLKALNKRFYMIIAAVLAALLIAFVVTLIRNAVIDKRISEQIAEIQRQADAGENSLALEGVSDLLQNTKQIKDYSEKIYQITETVLENTVRDEGVQEAYELYQELNNTMPTAVDEERFRNYALTLFENKDLPAVERWFAMVAVKECENRDPAKRIGDKGFVNALNTDEETLNQLASDFLDQLSDEMESGSNRDMKEMAENQYDLLMSLKINPDAALRFVYALNDAGYNAFEMFPDGIPLDLPIASNITNLLMAEESDEFVNMSTVLPVSIREHSTYNDKSINANYSYSQDMLKQKVSGMREDDGHYDVNLLTEYLFRIPEDMRPSSFSECTSLLALQNLYYYVGCTREETTSSGSSSFSSTSVTYYPMFSALDMVAVYDMQNPEINDYFYSEVHHANAEDDEWFNSHNTESSGLLSSSNMIGEFDMETLTEEYDSIVEQIGFYRFYWLFDNDYSNEEDSNDAE